MPAKKPPAKKVEEAPSPPQNLVRPPTPNDHQILATVGQLQHLVEVEVKWKNRLLTAHHMNVLQQNKMKRMENMIEQCRMAIKNLDTDIEELIESAAVPYYMNPGAMAGSVNSASMLGATVDVRKKSVFPNQQQQPPSNKPGGKGAHAQPSAPGELPPAPPAVIEKRKKEAIEFLGPIVWQYYRLPRLEKEWMTTQRPQTPMDMQAEIDEAVRLSTPAAELLAQVAAASPQAGQKGGKQQQQQQGKGAAAAAAAANMKSPPKPESRLSMSSGIGLGIDVEHISDLKEEDFLQLPVPRGLESAFMKKVLTLRSRRLKLESSIQHFQKTLEPLQARMFGLSKMSDLGNYSLHAVTPQIRSKIDEEASLQRIRLQEDEAFMKRATTAPQNVSGLTAPLGQTTQSPSGNRR